MLEEDIAWNASAELQAVYISWLEAFNRSTVVVFPNYFLPVIIRSLGSVLIAVVLLLLLLVGYSRRSLNFYESYRGGSIEYLLSVSSIATKLACPAAMDVQQFNLSEVHLASDVRIS